MTATQAGQPAKDPEDGPGANRGASNVDGTVADGAVTVDHGPADSGWFDAVPLTSEDGTTGGGTAERIAALRARLMTPMPDDRLWGWIGPLLVTVFAAILRFNRLSVPNAVIFDETYYAKDAWSILKHGVEWNVLPSPSNNADWLNNQIIAGHTNIFAACSGTSCGEYVVQPPVGKLFMAVGEWIYGLTTLGWRLAPAIFGTLAILVMCRVARRLTRSTLLGCTAGLLLSLDGLEFVLSRTGILDIFLMPGPGLGIRKWRVIAGILIGLACASKQYGVWYILAFAGLCIAWDLGARRTVGLRDYVRGALLRDGKWLPLTLGVIPLVTYTLTWMGWLVTNTGYDRDYAQGVGFTNPVLAPLYSLFEYHKEMLQFGVGLSTPHPYMSQPWDWFFITRPVAFYWNSYNDAAGLHVAKAGTTGRWVQEVLAIGNPAIWWVSIPAMAFCLGWWLTRRDWRAGAALLGVAAGWVSWLPFVSRTKFYYYALEFEPFLIICIVLCLGLMIGPATAGVIRRATGAVLAGIYVLAVLVLFWYFYPILSGKVIPYSDWLSHMWYTGLLGPASGWI
jgi:dolichyl-phosphate-mannose-protein mannosyltransferase